MMIGNLIDPSCLLSAILFLVSNAMDIAIKTKISNRQRKFNFQQMKDLDLDYIKKDWEFREEVKTLEAASGLLSAIACFSFCIPIIQVCWILSKGGKKRSQVHSFICMFAIGSSILELVTQLMIVGFSHATCRVAKTFHLDDWNGWKTLQLSHTITRGSLIWVDAFDYFALFVILILIGLAVSAEHAEKSNSIMLGKKWAAFGAVIGVLCLFEFTADVLRFVSWGFYSPIAYALSLFNSVIALPIWLLILGVQLPGARSAFENTFLDQTSSLELSELGTTPGNVNDQHRLQQEKTPISSIQINDADEDEFL